MRFALLVTAMLGTCVPTGRVDGGTFKFDLGTAQSELRSGFTRLTATSIYSQEAGFGWKSSAGLKEHHMSFSRQWEYNDSRGHEQPPPIYTNAVTCDCVRGDRPSSLLIDLGAGDYIVWLLCGLSAGSAREYHDFDISATGGMAPDQATVKIPGPYRFEKRELRVVVRDGPLSIDLAPRTDWILASVVVFPASQEKTVRDEFLDDLEKETYFLPPDVAAKWTETVHTDTRPDPEFSAAARDRGYAIFARHWSEVVYPNTIPTADELNPQLAAFAALGEFEPVTFSVLPFENLTGVRVEASDMRSGDAVIPLDCVEVRQVRCMLVRPNYSTFFSYHEAPDLLEQFDRMDLTKRRNQRFWITVKVPEDAVAGVYDGKLTFLAKGRQPADVNLRIRVLPIHLMKDPDLIHGMYYRDPLQSVHESNSPEANEYIRRKAQWERQDMVAHGMNSHISGISGLERDDDGNWTMDGAETEVRIALDRKYNLTQKPLVVSFPVGWWYAKLVDRRGLGSHLRLVQKEVPASFFDEVTRMVEAIELEKKKYDWPEFLYYPIDEPSTQEDSVRFMTGVLKAIKRVPGVRTYVTADPSHDQFEPMWPYVDVWCCQPFVFGYDKIRHLSEARNIEFWCYPNHISGENDHTPVRGARMTWGFGLWKSGFRSLIPWIYQAAVGDPANYLDGTSMDFFNHSTAEGRPIPVTLWEAYREGIDDGRYLYTLKCLIDDRKKRGGLDAELATATEGELQFIWDSIDVQEKYKHDDLWSGADFDAYRWLLASKILALQSARPQATSQ